MLPEVDGQHARGSDGSSQSNQQDGRKFAQRHFSDGEIERPEQQHQGEQKIEARLRRSSSAHETVSRRTVMDFMKSRSRSYPKPAWSRTPTVPLVLLSTG